VAGATVNWCWEIALYVFIAAEEEGAIFDKPSARVANTESTFTSELLILWKQCRPGAHRSSPKQVGGFAVQVVRTRTG